MIAWVSRNGATKNVASYRYRLHNPSLALKAMGVPNELFDEDKLYKYKVIIFSKAYSTENLLLAKKLLKKNKKVIFDFCDNHLFNPSGIQSYNELAGNIAEAINLASRITFSTEALQSRFLNHFHFQKNHTVVIPDLIVDQKNRLTKNLFHYLPRIPNFNKQKRLVWFGIHGSPNSLSGMNDILKYKHTLEKYYSIYGFKLVIVSNSLSKFELLKSSIKVDMEYAEWSEIKLFTELHKACGVLIPITVDDFTICKSNNRLLLPLLMNKSIIADSIPSYLEFKDYVYLDSWEKGLNEVLSNTSVKLIPTTLLEKFGAEAIGSQWLKETSFQPYDELNYFPVENFG